MSFHKSKEGILTTVALTCDARKGKDVCGNSAEVSMQDLASVNKFLFSLGWRLMRGHQVCGTCMQKYPKISFPRKQATR